MADGTLSDGRTMDDEELAVTTLGVLRHTLHCQLSAVGDQHRLEVVFDGQPVDPWQGSVDSIKQQPGVGDPAAKRIGIVVTKSNFVFHRIRLRMLEGDATPVRDARAD